jgi:hypothetical protein
LEFDIKREENTVIIQGKDGNGNPDPSKECLVDMDNLIDYVLLIDFTGACDNSISAFLPWPPPPGDGELNNLFALFNAAKPEGFFWIQHDGEHAMDTARSGDNINNFDPHPDISGGTELVNTDFYVGIPLTYAINKWSSRFRIYHPDLRLH